MISNRLSHAARIRADDERHLFHPWEDLAERTDAGRTILTRGEGIHVWDADGRRLIDGPGGMWCVSLGYARREMADAIAEQAMRLCYYSPWSMANETSARLAREIALRAPGDLNNVFFTTGGSTAVDTAIRFVHFLMNRTGRPAKKIVIGREKGYHGSTYLSASVTGKERERNWCDRETERVAFLPDVNPALRPEGMAIEEWCRLKVADLEETILALGPDRVAAFIAEPILASGGVIVPPPGYHAACLAVCRRHDVLYIADEVVTSFGRLGAWFASEEVFGMVPDIITTAKGLTSGYVPMGACIVSDRLMAMAAGAGKDGTMFFNGYTYSGHPLACAAALKTIEIIERDGILAHVRAVTPHFQTRLHAMRRHAIVGETRGIGLVGCVEGRRGVRGFGKRVDEVCERLGLIVRPIGNMCVFSPPLIITEAEIDEMFDILDRAIAEVGRELEGDRAA